MTTLDADAIIACATPLAHQQPHEIQPFNHYVIRGGETQASYLAEHVVDVPLAHA